MHQFCYASQSTSHKPLLIEDLSSILTEARDFNFKNNIVGALYFTNGYFFQCLEGEIATLNILLKKLYLDPRHYNIKLFEVKPIQQPLFKDWSMKYISKNNEVHQFCKNLGFEQFKPYEFEQKHVDLLLEYLSKSTAVEPNLA